MRRWLACFVVVAVALVAPALAAEKAASVKPGGEQAVKPTIPPGKGEIVKWDDATKTFTLKAGKRGREVHFVWNEKTKIEGAPKVGERVVVHYVREGSNTFVAQHVIVQASPPAKK